MQDIIITANRASSELLGYPSAQLIGMHVNRLFPSQTTQLLSEQENALLRKEPISELSEVPAVRRDGAEILLSLDTRLISEDDQPKGFQHIARDVTEQSRMRATLDQYIRQILTAQEDERKRIARELHDETAQFLLLISQRLDSLASDSTVDLSDDVRTYLEGVRHVTIETLADLRRVTQDLRPRILDDLGLVPALEWLGGDLERQTDLNVSVRINGTQRALRPEIQLLLFRIAQEALSNVRRHAEATQASLVLEQDQDRVRLTVTDNGKGFVLPTRIEDLANEGRLGILGMHERARLLGGTLSVNSEPGKGTVVVAEQPALAPGQAERP